MSRAASSPRRPLVLVPVAFAFSLSVASIAGAQAPSAAPVARPVPSASDRSIDDLNLLGGATTMPPMSDSVLGAESAFRRALFGKGMLLRVNAVPRYSLNLLDGPVPAAQQAYIGQRPTWILGLNPIFTADLRQLKLRQAQLHASVAWKWSTWKPAGPNTFALSSLYFFKRWGDRRVEMKAGYVVNDLEFVGLQVGGSTSTGALGVYAVLPNEVGMSYYPLVAPAVNVRVRGTTHTYVKAGAQRSLDAAGGLSTIDRNPTGFRLTVPGNGLLKLGEVGYQRASSASAHQVWVRAGYMSNGTLYTNRITGAKASGNYCAYVLADYQLTRPHDRSPGLGLYVGGSVMTVPERFNAYSRYYEARLYARAPFSSRPGDVLSLVASYRAHSRYVTDAFAAQGRTVWRSSPSLTGTYTMHVARGDYLSLGLGFVRGPAITPRVADTVTATANWSLYF